MRLESPARSVASAANQAPSRSTTTSAAAPAPSSASGAQQPRDAFVGPGQVTPEPITASATPDAPVKDHQTTTSTIRLDSTASVDALKLDLDLSHTYRGDLEVTLTSPSGKSAVISSRSGGSADDIKGSFDLAEFAGEPVAGDWTLTVKDLAARDEGVLNSWGLTIQPKEEQPPPPPPEDSDPMKHLEFLASDELRGRDSPSEGLDIASRYVQDILKKYGLQGPNAGAENPYEQAFDLWNFEGAAGAEGEDGIHDQDDHDHGWGHGQFEHGFYLDETLGQEDLQLLSQRYRESGLIQDGAPDFTCVEDVKEVAVQDGKTRNTMGFLEGTGPHKDEVIVIMAHLDHVGVDRQGRVYNGADDNASGSAVLLSAIPQLAQLQKEGKLDRSVMFVWTGGEEKGLVGSSYLANHPLPGLPNSKVAGVINADMVGRWDDQRLSVIDTDSRGRPTYFRDLLDKANEQMEDPFDRVNRDINQFRDRQDGAIWTRQNIPTLFLFEGLSNPNGGGDLIDEYHRPEDDLDLILRDNGGNKPRRIRDLLVGVVDMASNRVVESESSERRARAPRVAQELREGVVAWQ